MASNFYKGCLAGGTVGFVLGLCVLPTIILSIDKIDPKSTYRGLFQEAQKEINDFVQETGNGEWVGSLAGKTLTLNGKEVKNRKDLSKIIEAGISDGSWRAHLNTAARPSAATLTP